MLQCMNDRKLSDSVQRRPIEIGEGSEGEGVCGVAEVICFIQLGEEQIEGIPHGGLQLLMGSEGAALSSALS